MLFGNESGLEPSLLSGIIPYFILVLAIFLVVKYKEHIKNAKHEKKFRYFWAVSAIIFEVWFFMWTFIYLAEFDARMFWLDYTMIPIHLCALSLWLAVVLAFTKNKYVFRFVIFTGIMGPILTIVSGDVSYSFDHLRYWHYYLQHISTMVLVIYMNQVHGLKVVKYDWIKVTLVLFVASFIIVPFNKFMGTNYMYIYNTNGSPLEVIENWFVSYLVLLLGVVLFFWITEFIFLEKKNA